MSLDTPGRPDFEEMFRGLVKSVQSDEHGPALAKVESYDQDTQRATVKMVNQPWTGDTLVEVDVQQDVPVQWPGGGDGSLTFPLAAGDVGQLTPQATDISSWSASGTIDQGAPTKRKFSLSDVVFAPRVTSRAAPLPSAAYAAGATVLRGSDVRLGDSTADKLVARDMDQVHKTNAPPDLLAAWMAQVETAINTLAPGSISPLSTTFTQVGTVQATATKVKAK